MSTITVEQEQAILEWVQTHHIPSGLGVNDEACSIASINLVLTGRLTDEIPECMSEIIGRWIIGVQDAMPDAMRNSDEWKSLLPLAAGTGRDHEAERLALIMDWMWEVVLPASQPIADARGFGAEWRAMTTERTEAAAAVVAAWSAAAAARAAAWSARAAAWSAAEAARAEAEAARAEEAWDDFAPCALLRRLVEVGR